MTAIASTVVLLYTGNYCDPRVHLFMTGFVFPTNNNFNCNINIKQ